MEKRALLVMRVADIAWSSILITSLCYSSQHEIDTLPVCVKAVVDSMHKNCNDLVAITHDSASLLAMVSGSCDKDLIITLNVQYSALRPMNSLNDRMLHPMRCNDAQCEIIIKYMYSILDDYNVPYDDARREAEQKSLKQLKFLYDGYINPLSEITKFQKYMSYIGIMTLKSVVIGVPIGIIGIICYRWYEMSDTYAKHE